MKAQVFFYDIEVFPNYFTVTIREKGEGQAQGRAWTWGINQWSNDFRKIREFFNAKKKWFVGFNNKSYDDPIINFLIANPHFEFLGWQEVTQKIKSQSDKIIQAQSFKGGTIKVPHKWDKNFGSIDLMELTRVGMTVKSLKIMAVNIKWPLIMDLPYPINHHIQEEDLPVLKKYELNDVNITEAIYYHLQKEVQTRQSISFRYKVNVMSESNSGIGNVLFESLYSQATRQKPNDFKYLRSNKKSVSLSKIISRKVRFSSEELRYFLQGVKRVTVEKDPLTDKWEDWEELIKVNNMTYTIAKGGIHSVNGPSIYEATDDYYIIDADVESYYPQLVVNEAIKPDHLSNMFCPLMERLMIERVAAKKADPVKAAAFKIAINGAFGKMGFEHSWLFDPEALYGVTLNGQLFLLMLIEKLENIGIEVFYANTDGITAKVPKDKIEEYVAVCRAWSAYTGFKLEFANFSKFIISNVNSYIVVKDDVPTEEAFNVLKWDSKKGTLKKKGAMNKDLHTEDLTKAFKHPIVAKALEDYFVSGVPLEKTILEHDDIMDFCMAQKVGSTFDAVEIFQKGEYHEIQKTNRYLVSRGGGNLFKRKKTRRTSLVSGKGVIIMNDVEAVLAQYPDGVPVDRHYYINEARKILKQFEKEPVGQKSLF